MEEHNILIPLLLTLGAGLATGIGSAIAFFAKRTNKRLLSFSLGLSGGVMIYVSFVELFQQANTTLSAEWGAHTGVIVTVASFFAGILLIGVIDRLVPSIENPHEAHRVEEMDHQPHNPRLMRMGVMTALAIGIHNFPEGIATFTSAVDNMALGVAIAVAIAIHNIPEGIAVSIPIYYATGPPKGFPPVAPLGPRRTRRSHIGMAGADALHDPDADGLHPGRRGRHHGLHLDRRTAARGPRIRRGAHLHLRRGGRHGPDGRESDPAGMIKQFRIHNSKFIVWTSYSSSSASD